MKKLYFIALALIMPGMSFMASAMDSEDAYQAERDKNRIKLDFKMAVYDGDMEEAQKTMKRALKYGIDLPNMEGEITSLDSIYVSDQVKQLAVAAQEGHTDLVKFLLEHGAKKDEIDNTGVTPLMRAAAKGHLETVKALVNAGANLNLADKTNRAALDYAIQKEHQEIANYLRDHRSR